MDGKRTASSPMTQGAQSGCPMDIAPNMGIETRRPDLPSWTYSALEAATESLTLWGIEVAILCGSALSYRFA